MSNCLAFTMPLWTGAFAACGGGEKWGPEAFFNSALSLIGVVMVSQPGTDDFSPVGVMAGLMAGIVGGLLNYLFSCVPALRTTDSWYLVACQGVATCLFSLPSLLLNLGSDMGPTGAKHPIDSIQPVLAEDFLLATVGVLFVLSQQLRFLGLQAATSSTVGILLYTEIMWAFFFEQAPGLGCT